MTAAFGSGAYTMAQGIEKLLAQKHPWLRAFTQETPGFEYNLKFILTTPEARKKTIFYMSELNKTPAEQGTGIFAPTKYDTKDLKYLGVPLYATFFWFVTLDSKIKSIQDLAGKKVAFSAKGAMMGEPFYNLLTFGAGVKDIKPEYVGQDKATTYLLDGLVDASIGLVIGDPADSPPPSYIVKFQSPQIEGSNIPISITIMSQDLPPELGNETLEGYVEKAEHALKVSANNYSLISITDSTVSGLPAKIVSWSMGDEGNTLISDQAIFMKGARVYIITLAVLSDFHDKAAYGFNLVTSTFKFKQSSAPASTPASTP